MPGAWDEAVKRECQWIGNQRAMLAVLVAASSV